MNLAEVIAALTGLLAAVGAFYKVVVSSRAAVAETKKEEVETQKAQDEFTAALYQRILRQVEGEWEADRARRASDMNEVRGRLQSAEDKIETMRKDYRRSQRSLLDYITYLTGLIREHAPHVKVRPLPDDHLI